MRRSPDEQPILLIPDHSVFINSMMLQTDNGNSRFAQNAVRWLTNDGTRRRVLFLADGEVIPRFAVASGIPTE